MTHDQVRATLQAALGTDLTDVQTRTRTVGIKRPVEIHELWATVPRERIVDAVRALSAEAPAHLSVISGRDADDQIELLYHIAVGYGTEGGEVMLTLRLTVSKADAVVPSLCGVFSGAETTEREKREFLGVEFDGLPDARNLFLPDELTVHPWRKDEPELQKLMRRTVKWEERDGGA